MLLKCEISNVLRISVRTLCFNYRSHFNQKYSRDRVTSLEAGLFAVNKPKDLSSTEAVGIIKNTLLPAIPENNQDAFKVGHGGVLDQTATGVLAIGVGEGCKTLSKFLHGVKEYVVTGQLGTSTTTFNNTGDVTKEMPYEHVTKEVFLKTLSKFCGQITQTPPVYSALKLHGRRYADLAKEGVEVIPKPRLVKCYALDCIAFEPPLFKLRVKCGGGFYVRSLINDLGIEVGSCAHAVELHRTQHGIFKEHEAIPRSQWTVEKIIRCIQKTKKVHGHLFRGSGSSEYVRSKGGRKHKSVEHEKSIKFTDDMFDL